jgi:amino acid transporter
VTTADNLGIPDADDVGLELHVLGEVQILGQSLAMIGPSLSAAALIPLAFSVAGGGTWLTILIAMVGMMAVAVVVSAMARRHVSTGALYTLIPKGLGPSGGLLTMGGFALIAVAGQIISVIGFGASFAQFLSSAFNIGTSSHLELVFLDLAGLFVATIVVLRGIGLSTKVLFGLEGSAMVAILLLLAIVLIKHGHIIDHAQLGLHGASAHGVLLGMTFIVLSFGGFESAASLGVEARRPRRAVPIALIGSI